MTQWVKRDADALCVQLFGRLPVTPPQVAIFSLPGAFAATPIVPALAGRIAFVDKLQFSIDNTGTYWIGDTAVELYATAAAPTSALGGVEHIFERLIWGSAVGLPITLASPSAGSTFSGRVIWRYV